MANLKDIADKLHVSVSTVSRALNDSDEISEEVKEKVRKAAGEVGYTLRGRGGKATPEWNAIGIIVPEVLSEHYSTAPINQDFEKPVMFVEDFVL